MDRNQLIGILLILAMLVGYQFLVPKPPKEEQPTAQQTTITKPTATSAGVISPDPSDRTQPLDSAAARQLYGDFAAVSTGQEREIVLENKQV